MDSRYSKDMEKIDGEYQLVDCLKEKAAAKAENEILEAIVKFLEQINSYECPEIVKESMVNARNKLISMQSVLSEDQIIEYGAGIDKHIREFNVRVEKGLYRML